MKIFLLLSFFLFGCSETKLIGDQELRQKLFFECLEKIPKGPESTQYNDWDEVVSQCSECSYYMSLKRIRKDSVFLGSYTEQ